MPKPIEEVITADDIEEFRQLVKEHGGANLTVTEAVEVAMQLLRVLQILREVVRKNSDPSEAPALRSDKPTKS